MRMHPSITIERVIEAVRRQETTLDNPGFCIACGIEQEGCEPDARKYPCESCEKRTVYGASEIMMTML